ncbi:MAG: FecR domain-containing protein [Leptospiraceae bacterium]|nr:FecR domain-containing protein [Leptospiraceae bacterium]
MKKESTEKIEKKVAEYIQGSGTNEYSRKVELIERLLKKQVEPKTSSFPEAKELWKRAYPEEVNPKLRILPFQIYRNVAAIAAGIALLFSGSFFLLSILQNPTTKNQKLAAQDKAQFMVIEGELYRNFTGKRLSESDSFFHAELVSTHKQKARVQLGDGKFVRLSQHTELQIFKKDDELRVILIKGEAFFTINKLKKAEQFIVSANELLAEVRGTKFLVRTRAEQHTEIHVYEGSVAVFSKKSSTEKVLYRGEGIEIDKDQNLKSKNFLVAKSRTGKTTSPEDLLYERYKRLEKIILKNGTEYRGVIVDMNPNYVEMETVEGRKKIARSQIKKQILLK